MQQYGEDRILMLSIGLTFLGCRHVSLLDAEGAELRTCLDSHNRPTAAEKGLEHEAAYLQRLRNKGSPFHAGVGLRRDENRKLFDEVFFAASKLPESFPKDDRRP